MDIRIEALNGPAPPNETFVSMRIGDYQKQSRFGCSKSYRFPQDEGNGFARLEVFQRIGHLSISLEKLRTSDQDVQVPLDTPDVNFLPMRVGIQGLQEDKSKAKVKTRLDAAQKYLAEHQLEEIIADAMREVIHEKPEDPYSFLSKEIMKHAKKPFLPPLRNDGPSNFSRDLRSQKPNRSEKLPPIGGLSQELSNLRVEARDVLLKSAKDGSLAQALATVNQEPDLEDLRQQARATLLQSAKDGTLGDALRNTREEVSSDVVRVQARDALLRSAQDGSLASALRGQAMRADQMKVEDLRTQARDALLRASKSGTLERVLSQGKSEKVAQTPVFKYKPSVGSWLVKKPFKVPKPWYYEDVQVAEVEDEKVVKDLQAVILEKDGEIAALKAKLREGLEAQVPALPPQVDQALKPGQRTENDAAKASPASPAKSTPAEAQPKFALKPSVGTWLAPAPKKTAAASPSSSAPTPFALKPSVGTWLAYRSAEERPKSSSILEKRHSKLLAMDQEELIKGYQKEIKKRDQEIENLKSKP